MEKAKPSNPTAFPTTEENWHNANLRTEGMSLRDYFAAKAMQSLVSAYQDKFLIHQKDLGAREAYQMADAMLVEREKETSNA